MMSDNQKEDIEAKVGEIVNLLNQQSELVAFLETVLDELGIKLYPVLAPPEDVEKESMALATISIKTEYGQKLYDNNQIIKSQANIILEFLERLEV